MPSPRSPSGRPLGPTAIARAPVRELPHGPLGPTERYVIAEYLAEGGMGAIYLGKRIGVGGFEKQVVLKQLLPEFGSDPQITELFLQEARLSASLDHRSIVYTMDLIQVAGSYYMIMEFVSGGDLRALLRRARRRGARFSPAAALLIGTDLLDALDYAHQRKQPDGKPLSLIHRDISPSNILLSASGEVKLTDFGIAKAATYNTTAYKIRGKVGYMSPEQARGEEIDPRSDLFSLAVVLYEVVCGERLFVGNLAQSPAQIYGAPIAPPSEHCRELPTDFDRVLLKALSLSREGRFQTAKEFQDALLEVAKRHDLLIGHADMAAHLRKVCGPDPGTWLKDEDRTGTAMIAPGSDDDDEPGDEEDDDEGAEDLVEADRPRASPSGRASNNGVGAVASRDPRNALRAAGSPMSSSSSRPKEAVAPAHEQPGSEQGTGENIGEMTEPTSLMSSSLVEALHGPLLEETQPIERQPPPLNIAAMARKMISQPLVGTKSQSKEVQKRRARLAPPIPHDDDTAAMTAPRPATVRMLTQTEADLPPALPPAPGWRMTQGGVLLVGLLVVMLLGLGIALGMLLSNPRLDRGEPRPPRPSSSEVPTTGPHQVPAPTR